MKTKSILSFSVFLLAVALHSCTPGAVDLWNGKDFSGWHFVLSDSSLSPAENWNAGEGFIHCNGLANGYMRTKKKYAGYELTVEWRWPEKPGNSGVLLNMQAPDKVWPNCIECQLQAEHAGDFIIIGPGRLAVNNSLYDNKGKSMHIPKMEESSEKPAGEWNRYRIINNGKEITCYVNGVLQNKGINPSPKEGYICLQSEGAPIEFRNIRIKMLK